jgi:hypothetical protein
MASNAEEYAEHVARRIYDNTTDGAPFGWIESGSDLWTYDAEEAHENALNEASAYDYVSNALEIIYRVDSNRRYRSAEILITVGGPNAYIDTSERSIHVTWGGSSATIGLPSEFIDGLDEACAELWNEGA